MMRAMTSDDETASDDETTDVATEADVATTELPVIEPDVPAAPEDEHAPEPPKPMRTIVIGDRDGLTDAHRAPVQPVPAAVPNVRRGRLVFGGDVSVTTAAREIGPPAPVRPVEAETESEANKPGVPPRTIVIGDADESRSADEIDPRIKERRHRVLRAAGLRRLRWVLAVVVVIALIGGFNLTLRSPLFQVQTVQVTGTDYIDAADLASVTDPLVGRPLVSVDLGEIRRAIEENVWVRTVDVSRSWRHTIRIDIEERRPVAYYPGDDGLIHLVDVDGLVLATLEGLPTQFVMVEGIANSAGPGEGAPEQLLPAIRVANDLPETLRNDVQSVRVVDVGVVLQLRAGGVVLIGDTTDLRDKLVAALAVRGQCPPGSYAQLDVRVPSRPAVTPKTGCGPPTAAKP